MSTITAVPGKLNVFLPTLPTSRHTLSLHSGKQLTHRPHDGTTQVVEAAKARRGDAQAPHQVPSQYAAPQPHPELQHQLEIEQDMRATEMPENGTALPPKIS